MCVILPAGARVRILAMFQGYISAKASMFTSGATFHTMNAVLSACDSAARLFRFFPDVFSSGGSHKNYGYWSTYCGD